MESADWTLLELQMVGETAAFFDAWCTIIDLFLECGELLADEVKELVAEKKIPYVTDECVSQVLWYFVKERFVVPVESQPFDYEDDQRSKIMYKSTDALRQCFGPRRKRC